MRDRFRHYLSKATASLLDRQNGPPSIFSEWPSSRRARLRELTEASHDEALRARILGREEHMLRGVELDQLAEIHEAGKV